VGIEQHLFDEKLSLSFVYFHNDYDNYITYISETFPNPGEDPADPWDNFLYIDHYDNLNKAEAKGFEVEMDINPCENFTIATNYTRTDTRDKSNGGQLLRRPKHLSSLSANYVFRNNLQLNLIVNYIGRRIDVNNSTANHYTRVDLAGSYPINEHFQLFSRIENLFNEHYQEIKGYDAAGISAFGGVKLSF
jgi:vitamin B12 transporter